MSPVARFLARNAQCLAAGGPSLLINPPPDLEAGSLGSARGNVGLFTQDFGTWRQLKERIGSVEFGTLPPQDGPEWANIVLIAPREKPLLELWLKWCAGALAHDGTLWLAGENRSGIRSAPSLLGNVFGNVARVDSARHCQLLKASRPIQVSEPAQAGLFKNWMCETKWERFELCSSPGVFAHGHLDPATRLLVDGFTPEKHTRSVLDFGTGCGVIAVALKRRAPQLQLTLVDSHALALESSRRSLALNGISGKVLASDGLSELEGRFDLVVTNPPFHQGNRTEPRLSQRLLHDIGNFLNPRGQLVLVANRHLPYRNWLDELFGQHEVLASDSRFHVLRSRAA